VRTLLFCSDLYSYIFSSRHQDPFETHKTRLARKLARRAEAQDDSKKQPDKTQGDDINWFGVKVGTGDSAFGGGAAGVGVGKYLGIKRPLDQVTPGVQANDVGDDAKKKRKIGFGNFDSW
jgi:peptidyl-prolyl cis-trans isomerase-like protein 2